MSVPDIQRVKQALTDAGIEIYRTREAELHIAERIRLHIMDSGVRVDLGDAMTIRFTARSQRSDFPHTPAEELFHKVREVVGAPARARGYSELSADTVEVKDPVDESKVLDVWHEVTYGKRTDQLEEVVEEVHWALEIEKYVTT